MRLNLKINISNINNKGLTIIEVIISFSISIMLLLALFMIVYWGSNINQINQKIIDISNIINFISYDLQNNVPEYFSLDSNNNLQLKNNAITTLLNKLKTYNYQIDNTYNYNIERISIDRYANNLYKITVVLNYEHKTKIRKKSVTFIISTQSLKINPQDIHYPPSDIDPNNITFVQ